MTDYSIHPPREGFTKVSLYRAVRSDTVVVEIPELGASFDFDQQSLTHWLKLIGVEEPDRVVDYAWNFRHIDYDLKDQRMTIPDDQTNPYQGDVPVVTYSKWANYQDPFGDSF